MNSICRTLFLLGVITLALSCKNESKEAEKSEEVPTAATKKVLTVEEKNIVNSVLTKAMVTPESKNFVSMLLSAGLTDMLSKDEGPFTIFAPSNSAFGELDEVKRSYIFNPANKEAVVALLKSHIVAGNLDSATLVKNIKNANGNYKLITLTGITYTASREGTDIVLTDAQGRKAVLGKSDITGSNGILHIVDNVLGLN
jgi:uncharacterized surface protein with fasciclin (FAS1) repeats